MKAKIRRGSGFRGVVNYALGKDEPRIVGGNMSSTIARDLAAEFGVSRALRPDIEKPVWHCSLSAAPGEKLSDDQWQAVAERHMRGMGFSDATQFVVIKHTARDDQTNPPPDKVLQSGKVKKGGPETEHVHIIASRIGLDARIWLGQNDVHLAIEQTQQIEREFGLVETKGFDAPKDAKALTRAEAGMAERTGELAPREYLQTTLAKIIADKPTMASFIERAQAAGIELRPNLASTGRMNGFSFGHKDMNFSGSQLGAAYKWASLQKSVDYQPERDNDKLRALLGQKPEAAAPAPAAPVADRPAVTAPAAPKAPTVAAPAPTSGRPAAPIPVAMPRSAAPAAGRKTPAPRGATGRIRGAARIAMQGLAKWAQDSIEDIERIAKALEKWAIRAQEIRAERERTVRAQRAAEARAALNARRQAPAPSPAAAGGSQPQPNAPTREQLMERAAAARAAVEARRQASASAPATPAGVASRPPVAQPAADLRPAPASQTPPAAARPNGAAPAGDLERLESVGGGPDGDLGQRRVGEGGGEQAELHETTSMARSGSGDRK